MQSTTLTAPPLLYTAASPITAAALTDTLQPVALRDWAAHRPQLPLLSSHPALRPGIYLSVVEDTHGVSFMALTTRNDIALHHSNDS